jgi:hypothetical protein
MPSRVQQPLSEVPTYATPWLSEAELDVYVSEWGGPDFKVP